MAKCEPSNALTDHEHEVWLSTYREASLIERGAIRMRGDNTNHAEVAANAALAAYRRTCAAPPGGLPIEDAGPHPKDRE